MSDAIKSLRPTAHDGGDLLELATFIYDHARGHENVCELHADDLEALVFWAAHGLGVDVPETQAQRNQRLLREVVRGA